VCTAQSREAESVCTAQSREASLTDVARDDVDRTIIEAVRSVLRLCQIITH